jgi:opacity protein-like surface antigen
MIRTHILIGLSLVFFFSGSLNAKEWRFSVGANYRSFDNIDFKTVKFRNPTNANFTEYVNGSFVDDQGIARFLLVHDSIQAPDHFIADEVPGPPQPDGNITLDRILFAGDKKELDGDYGLIIGASRILETSDPDIQWQVDLTLGVINSVQSELFNGVATTDTRRVFDAFVNPVTFEVLADSDDVEAPVSTTGEDMTNGLLNYHLDIDMVTLGLGISGLIKDEKMGFVFGAGPSVTYAELDVKKIETVTWGAAPAVTAAGVAPGTNIYTARRGTSDRDYVFGFYLNMGVQYDLTERIALGLTYRFDYTIDEATTDLANVDLEGSSGELKLIYSF